MRVAVFRREHFNAAHRLHNPLLTDEENARIYGRCNYPNFHGHNYELEVRVTGEVDPRTGYVMDMKELGDLIKREVHSRFDHKNLNLDTEHFKNRIASAENIVVVIYGLLRPHLKDDMDLQIRLYETELNYVEYQA